MNILFTLCGRAGSKGVKGKNARDFLDIPLVWYSMAGVDIYMNQVKKNGDRVDVVLNTDSEDLMQLVSQVKDVNVTVLRREPNLGGDKVPKVVVILDSLLRAEKQFNVTYDMVVDLDITSPLRIVQDIKNVIDRKVLRPEVDVVYSVTHARRNPYFNMVKEENGFFCKAISSSFTTRQEAPVFYDMNASIYAYSPKALKEKEQSTFFNSNCDAVVMMDTGILDIDSEEDYHLMQVIAKYLFEEKDGFKEVYDKVKSWR
ncbi:acylneuraminate cytidylyltransferase family protein [Bacteroides xylanisolvens]|uniref:Acylneuraminate cytidylyltransferase family protein n=1 Tax=Bacteroides xylanisolvens TaxID=371601 RepID=A0A415HFS9_9BACE|nr:acylneuraminate cytidylyltransferase family protein [Bacteroides xylanisolvens]RHK91520.1 acylneuraminate cytidylyltransferase family protein [Bacteroides xylanisolvens]